jgi:hypothetical protein
VREFLHGVTPYPQPSPARNPGGDCFACAITATLRHIHGESAPTFDQVWEAFLVEQEYNGEKRKHLRNTWHGYRHALYELTELVGRMEVQTDFAARGTPQFGYLEGESMAWWPAVDESQWAKRLDAWLRAGWYAFASIRLDPNPTGEWLITPEGPRRVSTDHFVVLDGVRCGWRKHPTVAGSASLVYQVHVVCSARGGREYWIDVDTFLREHGAGAWWLIRPGDYGDLVDG